MRGIRRWILGLWIALACTFALGAQTNAVVRGTSQNSGTTGATFTVPLPTGAQAGDLMVISAAADSAIGVPSGWNGQWVVSGQTWNPLLINKTLASGDITTGSITLTQSSSGDWNYLAVDYVGTLTLRSVTVANSGINGSHQVSITAASTTQVGDYALLFASTRLGPTPLHTWNVGSLAASQAVTSDQVLYTIPSVAAAGAFTGVATMTTSGSGYGAAIVVVEPPTAVTGQTQINGNLATPDSPAGGTFTGNISVSLSRGTVTNTCATPVQVIPFSTISIPVVNGVVTPTNLISTDCLAPRLPYAIQVFDASNNLVYSDNWYIPQTTTGGVNIGNLSTVQLAPAINVSVPGAVVINPAASQTIVQPSGTTFSVNTMSVTGTLSLTNALAGSITGNAATATNLAHTPSGCSAGYYATGIGTNGNASCSNSFPTQGNSQTYLQVTGLSGTYPSQGSYVEWNLSGGFGEADFINQRGAGVGGFRFYNATNGGTLGPVIAFIDAAGNYGSSAGAISFEGNSYTTSAFATAPTRCATGSFATGIGVSGNAVCATPAGLGVQHARASGCTTGSSTFSTCTTAIAWPAAFTTTTYDVSCTGIGPSDARAALNGITGQFTNGVNIQTVTEGSVAVHYTTISCVAVGT